MNVGGDCDAAPPNIMMWFLCCGYVGVPEISRINGRLWTIRYSETLAERAPIGRRGKGCFHFFRFVYKEGIQSVRAR